MSTLWPLLTPLFLSFVLALALTPVAGYAARRWGMTAPVRPDRWHRKPTALLGGTAIMLATILTVFWWMPLSSMLGLVMSGSMLLGFVGFVDDLWRIGPRQKLLGQLVAAALVMLGGLIWPGSPWFWLNLPITLFWLVGITNAMNLLDNMDGLSAGAAAIAALGLATHFARSGQATEAALLVALAGALLGFLIYNWSPASIFMGDCGSLFVGFYLATAGLLASQSAELTPVAATAMPLFALALPIFDTTLVTILRTWAGRPISQGGRDHSSHRLVQHGLSERAAVGVLYAVTGLGVGIGLLTRDLTWPWIAAAGAAYLTFLLGFGVFLGRVAVYR